MFGVGNDRGRRETPEETTISTICNLGVNLANEAVNSLRTSVARAGPVLKNSNNHKDYSSDCVQHLKLAAVAQV